MAEEIVNIGGGTVNVTNSAIGNGATVVINTSKGDKDKTDSKGGKR